MSTPIGPNNQKPVEELPRQKPIIPPINTFLLDMPLPLGRDRIFQKRNESLAKPDLLVDEIRESNNKISAKLSELIKDMNELKKTLEKTAEEWKRL